MNPCSRLALLTATAFLLASANAPAIKHEPPREVSGHPEVVLIVAKHSQSPRTGFCSGVLLSPTTVLTVAHGVAGYDRWEVTAPYARGGAAQAAGKAIRTHPDYKAGASEHDLAVLTLDHALEIGGKFPALPDAKLYPIDTALLVVGRTVKGKPSERRLFEATSALVAIRGENNLYGGNPQLTEPGDSGGPVYLARQDRTLIALVEGALDASRGNVPTDIFIPLGGKNRTWLLRQLRRKENASRDR